MRLQGLTTYNTAGGLKGSYYSGDNFRTVVFTRFDHTVDFSWGRGAPASFVDVDGFSVRWTGALKSLYSEEYTLSIDADEGVRVREGMKKTLCRVLYVIPLLLLISAFMCNTDDVFPSISFSLCFFFVFLITFSLFSPLIIHFTDVS